MFGRVFWAGVQWTLTIFLVGLLVSSTVDAAANVLDCVKELADGVVTINGNCSSTQVTLEVAAKDLEFVMKYAGNAQLGGTLTKLKVGGCLVEGEISAGGNSGPQLSFPALGELLLFPINGKTSPNELTLKSQKEIPCEEEFKKTKSGSLIVPIDYHSDPPLPSLDLVFKNAKIYWGEVDKSGWDIRGWKLWSSIGGGLVIVVLLIVAVGLVVYWRWRKQNEEGRETATSLQGNNRGTVKRRKNTKKEVPAVNPMGDTTALMFKAGQKGKLQTAKPKTFEGEKLKTAEEGHPYDGVKWYWSIRPIPNDHLERLHTLLGDPTERKVFCFMQKFPIIGPRKTLALRDTIHDFEVAESEQGQALPEWDRKTLHMLRMVEDARAKLEENPEWRPA